MTCALLIQFAEHGIGYFGKFFNDLLDFLNVVGLFKFFASVFHCVFDGLLVGFVDFVRVIFHEFFNGEDKLFRAVFCLDAFLTFLVFVGVFFSVFDSRVNVFFGQIAACGKSNRLALVGRFVDCGYRYDAVCVDIESNFDLRYSARCRRNAYKRESAKGFVVFRKLTFALQYVDFNAGLVVGCG